MSSLDEGPWDRAPWDQGWGEFGYMQGPTSIIEIRAGIGPEQPRQWRRRRPEGKPALQAARRA